MSQDNQSNPFRNRPRPAWPLIVGVVAVALHAIGQYADMNPNAGAKRFVRGTGDYAEYHSFVVPLDGQEGVALEPTGDNTNAFPPEVFTNGSPWFLRTESYPRYHYDYTNSVQQSNGMWTVEFVHPLVAFGSSAGATPLYPGREYGFGIYGGSWRTNERATLIIKAYERDAFTNGATGVGCADVLPVQLPSPCDSADWEAFAANGFRRKLPSFHGLDTEVSVVQGLGEGGQWGVWPSNGAPYRLTHRASSDDHVFGVEMRGFIGEYPDSLMAWDPDAYWYWEDFATFAHASRLYTLDFEEPPPWRSIFIHEPHFDGEPMPEQYAGKGNDELLYGQSAVTNAVPLTPAAVTNVDNSTELRRHPLLDQFVRDMGNDPIALAGYVQDEIGLTDALAYNDDGSVSEKSINDGGVKRGALAVFQEQQGSPKELCGLLVYLLRQAGVPAAYVFGPEHGVKVPDAVMSRVLRMQLRGAVDYLGQRHDTNSLLSVDYPWVTAYVTNVNGSGTNRWVHLFPWLKDTEVQEGRDPYEFLPDEYDSGWKWLRAYMRADTNLLSLDPDNNSPLFLFPQHVEREMAASGSSLAPDSLGVRYRNRRRTRATWDDFARPFWVTNSGLAFRTNLSQVANAFDTVRIQVSNSQNGNKIDTGEWPMADLHNRRLMVYQYKSSGDFYFRLAMAPFRPGVGGSSSFGTGNFTDMSRAQVRQEKIGGGSAGTTVTIAVDHSTHRGFTNSTANSFLGVSETRSYGTSAQIRLGDLAAICLNTGRATRRMLDVHAVDFWNEQRRIEDGGGSTTVEAFQGTLAYLMGMGYYEKVGRALDAHQRLHKARVVSFAGDGLAKLDALRLPDGMPAVSDGQVHLIAPSVDMYFNVLAFAGAGLTRMDTGGDPFNAWDDFAIMAIGDVSAQEHEIIGDFFQDAHAISTTRLLQLAQQAHMTNASLPGVIELNRTNLIDRGNAVYQGTNLMHWDPSMWAKITNAFAAAVSSNYVSAFITPGPVTAPTGSTNAPPFRGMGAMVLNPKGGNWAALISKNMNGGAGSLPNYAQPAFNPNQIMNNIITPSDSGVPSWHYIPDVSTEAATFKFTMDMPTTSLASTLASSPQSATWYFDPADELYAAMTLASANIVPTGEFRADLWTATIFQVERGQADTSPSFLGTLAGPLATYVMDPVSALSGEFYIDEVDLTLPGPMPLQVRRNYSSQNLARNQLGHGWKLNYMPFLSIDATTNLIYCADPDGSTIAYRRNPANSNLYLPSPADNPELVNVSYGSIGSTANPMQSRIERAGGTNYTVTAADGSRRLFSVRSYPIGSGASTLYRTRPYLDRWEDSRSNMLWFAYGTNSLAPDYGQVRRIQGSGGQALGMNYDVFGRVTESYTVDGRRVAYEYDRHGDLVRVSRPDGSVLNYEYGHAEQVVSNRTETYSDHLVIREVRPDGRILVNAYDDQRRVTNQCATVGADINPVRNATFIYSNDFVLTNQQPVSGHTIVRDAYDRDTVYRYAAGLVTNIEDALGQHIHREWYDESTNQPPGGYPRSLKREVDKRGLITEYRYDAAGNVTNLTVTGDLAGDGGAAESRTIETLYDARQLPTQTVDLASGMASRITYGTGNQAYLALRVERYAGATLVGVVTNGYRDIVAASNLCARGMLTLAHTEAPGAGTPSTTAIGYDPRGYPTAQTNYTGTADPPVVKTFRHNARGEVVLQTDADGRTAAFEYDPIGRPTWVEYREGGALKGWNGTYYNLNGEVEWIDGPRYGPEDYVWRKYDGAGRPLEETRWRSRAKADGSGVEAPQGDALYATTFFKHDLFGNLTAVVDARGNLMQMEYDDVGQMTARRRFEGRTPGTELSSEDFVYEAGGQVAVHTNALHGVTRLSYTQTGQVAERQDPDGTTRQWRYRADGRIEREILPNGSYWETTYDDDQRKVTRTLKASGGSALRSEIARFDERGNALSTTLQEAGGGGGVLVTTRTFDGLNRPKTETGPAGSGASAQRTTTWTYDASGRVTKVSNGLGQETETVTDILGRPVTVKVKDGANVVRQTTYAYSADHNAVTITEGTGVGAISRTVWTDASGNTVLTVNGDGSHRRTIVDSGGLPLLARDEMGRETSFIHDGLGRLTSRTLPGGAAETLGYDAAGNLTNRVMPGGVSHRMTYDDASRLTSEILRNGAATTRSFGYAYHASGDGIGLLASVSDPRGITIAHSYDAFRRAEQTAASGPDPGHDITTTRQYDWRGLATNIAQVSDAPDHPATAIARSFDGYGQITGETVTLGGQTFGSFGQSWDAAGRRTALTPVGFGAGAPAYAFGHRADGALSSVTAGDRTYEFGFSDNGLLDSRSGDFSITAITSRDARGRIMGRSVSSGGTARLTETLTWNPDGTLQTYDATRNGAPVASEIRAYGYDARQRLLSESFASGPGNNALGEFEFDGGTANGIGVRTLWQIDDADHWRATAVDTLARVTEEESFDETRMIGATGEARGAASVLLDLDGRPVDPVGHPGWADTNGAWSATLRAEPGAHMLTATAHHPGGTFSAVTNSAFSVLGTNQIIDVAYDAAGNVIARAFADGRTQSLAWDALGRMVSVVETNGAGDGYRWTAAYDPFGRRLRTTHTPLDGGTALDDAAQRVDSFFDPEIEFLEIGASASGPDGATRNEWKVYGPDLDGAYGGLQGIGGLEAVIDQDTGASVGVVSDSFGNGVAWIPSPGGAPVWNPCRVTGYGPAPDAFQKPFGTDIGLAEATVWRSRHIDATGFFWLGARYYEPHSGRFLSPDPLGHAASWSLYDYAGGDPVNAMDPDGRVATAAKDWAWNTGADLLQTGWDAVATPLSGMTELVAGRDIANRLFGSSVDRMTQRVNGIGTLGDTSLGALGGDRSSQAAMGSIGSGLWNGFTAGGEGRSAAYRITYGTLNAASLFVGAGEVKAMGMSDDVARLARTIDRVVPDAAGGATQLEFGFARDFGKSSGLVIGRGADIDAALAAGQFAPGEYRLSWFSTLPSGRRATSAELDIEWLVNEKRLREVMELNLPIRDVSRIDDFGGFFLNRERYTLQFSGWRYDNGSWLPPGQ